MPDHEFNADLRDIKFNLFEFLPFNQLTALEPYAELDRESMELVLEEIGRRRLLVPLPFWVADLQAAILQLLPVPPLTRDQVLLLQRDNVVDPKALKLADLGITPTAAEAVVRTYLDRFRPGGRFRGPPANTA